MPQVSVLLLLLLLHGLQASADPSAAAGVPLDLINFAKEATRVQAASYDFSPFPYHAWNHAIGNAAAAQRYLQVYCGLVANQSLVNDAVALAGLFHDVGYPFAAVANKYHISQVFSICEKPQSFDPSPTHGHVSGHLSLNGSSCIANPYGLKPVYSQGHENASTIALTTALQSNDTPLPSQYSSLRQPQYMLLSALYISCTTWNMTPATGGAIAVDLLSQHYPLPDDLLLEADCKTIPPYPEPTPDPSNAHWAELLECLDPDLVANVCRAARYGDFSSMFQPGFICSSANICAEFATYGGNRANTGKGGDVEKDGVIREELRLCWEKQPAFVKLITDSYLMSPAVGPLDLTVADRATSAQSQAEAETVHQWVEQQYRTNSTSLDSLRYLEQMPLFERTCSFELGHYRVLEKGAPPGWLDFAVGVAEGTKSRFLQAPIFWSVALAGSLLVTVSLLVLWYHWRKRRRRRSEGWQPLKEMELLMQEDPPQPLEKEGLISHSRRR